MRRPSAPVRSICSCLFTHAVIALVGVLRHWSKLSLSNLRCFVECYCSLARSVDPVVAP